MRKRVPWCVAVTGINNREVWKLEASPSDSIGPVSSYNDGSSSSFGSPNRWNGGANVQDFSALRVPEPAALTLFGRRRITPYRPISSF